MCTDGPAYLLPLRTETMFIKPSLLLTHKPTWLFKQLRCLQQCLLSMPILARMATPSCMQDGIQAPIDATITLAAAVCLPVVIADNLRTSRVAARWQSVYTCTGMLMLLSPPYWTGNSVWVFTSITWPSMRYIKPSSSEDRFDMPSRPSSDMSLLSSPPSPPDTHEASLKAGLMSKIMLARTMQNIGHCSPLVHSEAEPGRGASFEATQRSHRQSRCP